jgi:isopenicillin-N epimerase
MNVTAVIPAPAVEDPATLRAQFLLRPEVVFLNHGSFGACPRPVFEDYQRWQLELERQPVEFLGRRITGLLAEARARLAAFLNVAADEVVYFPNPTTAINMIARSLDLQPGDEVLTTDHEYGAMDRTWRVTCARAGAVYVQRPLPLPMTTPEEFVERFWAGVTPRTRVIFISHITSATALIFPVREICRRARAAGLLCIVDGAHAPGQIPVDLADLGADVYTGALHKWVCAPKGCSFVYVRRELQPRFSPLVVSWGWESEKPSASLFVDHHEYQGTRDFAPYLAAPAALDFQAAHQWDAVRARCHARVREARTRVAALTGLPPIAPDAPAWFAQMATLPLPPCDLDALKRRLVNEHHVEIPAIRWNDLYGVRISVQGYNGPEDVDALVAALEALLPQVVL